MSRVRICMAVAVLAVTGTSLAGIAVADASTPTNVAAPMADMCLQPPAGPLVCVPFVVAAR